MSTASGIQRSYWNDQAIQNFVDTFGFGAGNGSERASSFPVALLANLGFLGALVYALFVLTMWLRARGPTQSPASAIKIAARSACLGWLIAATASGGFVDLGLPFFAFAALASAQLLAKRTRLVPMRADVAPFSSAEADA